MVGKENALFFFLKQHRKWHDSVVVFHEQTAGLLNVWQDGTLTQQCIHHLISSVNIVNASHFTKQMNCAEIVLIVLSVHL